MRRPYDGILPITSEFGYRRFLLNGQWVEDNHGGIDIGGIFPVLAAGAGTVVAVQSDGVVSRIPSPKTPANFIIIDHGGGLRTKYWHLGSVAHLPLGSRVSEGQYLGISGRTGYATGDHLHFAVELNGVNLNPRNYINFSVIPNNNMEIITIPHNSGWGLSHVAQLAGYADASMESSWQRIAELNGYSSWRALQEKFDNGSIAGTSLAVRRPASTLPAPNVTNKEIEEKDREIKRLEAELKNQEEEAAQRYQSLRIAEAEKDKLQEEEYKRLEIESLSRQEGLKARLEEEVQKYEALKSTSIPISNNGFKDQISHVTVNAIAAELEARGLKERWHRWVDNNIASTFLKQILKYTWPAWIFFLVVAAVAWANIYSPTPDPLGQVLSYVAPVIATMGTAVIQFLITNYDKDGDKRVDFDDFDEINP